MMGEYKVHAQYSPVLYCTSTVHRLPVARTVLQRSARAGMWWVGGITVACTRRVSRCRCDCAMSGGDQCKDGWARCESGAAYAAVGREGYKFKRRVCRGAWECFPGGMEERAACAATERGVCFFCDGHAIPVARHQRRHARRH
eukprot:IDg14899t1